MFWTKQLELEERAKDREMFLSAIREIVDAQNRQAEAVIAQAHMLQHFFDAFMTSEQPDARVLTDEDEAALERQRWLAHGES